MVRLKKILRQRGLQAIGRLLMAGGLALAGVRAMAADAATAAAMHTFTNANGTTMEATILSVVGDEVNLQRADGQKFRPKISIFSKPDQSYIRQWVARSAPKGVFLITATTSKGTLALAPPPYSHTTASSWNEHYDIRVKNQTTLAWPRLHFLFVEFKLTAQFGQKPPDDFKEARVEGSFLANGFGVGQEQAFSLQDVPMLKTSLDNGYYMENGLMARVEDKMKGLWLRIYDDDGNLIQEWATDKDLPAAEPWMSAERMRAAMAAAPAKAK